MGSSEFPSKAQAIEWGASRGASHAVVVTYPNHQRIAEIRAWLFGHDETPVYYRWPARDEKGTVKQVWCFADLHAAVDFRIRFG